MDMSPHDKESITANDATVKDMEVNSVYELWLQSMCFSLCVNQLLLLILGTLELQGAAVAYVADIFKVPTILIKGVTDIVDGNRPTSEEFLENLAAVTANLDESVTKVIDFISGKCLSDL